MVRDFHKIIGEEARAQVLELTGALPDAVAACVGGGSNAMGIFHAFLDDADVQALRVRGGRRRPPDRTPRGNHHRGSAGRAARRAQLPAAGRGRPDHRVALDLRGTRLPGRRARARLARATSAGPSYLPITDDEAMQALRAAQPAPRASSRRSSRRTPSPAPSSSGKELGPDATILVNLSGRGDKDMETAGKYFEILDSEALAREDTAAIRADDLGTGASE